MAEPSPRMIHAACVISQRETVQLRVGMVTGIQLVQSLSDVHPVTVQGMTHQLGWSLDSSAGIPMMDFWMASDIIPI